MQDVVESPSIRDELTRYLEHDTSLLDCLMLKTPIRKLDKSWLMPSIFLGLNIITYILLGCVIFPVYQFEWLIYLNILIESTMVLFWLISMFTNPGYITKPKEIDFLNLLQMIDPV